MKKFFISIGAFAMMLTLSACGNKTAEQSLPQDTGSKTSVTEDKGMVETMVEKMAGAQKCLLKEDGKVVSTVYMNGERMRADGDASVMGDGEPGDMATVIMDGEWMYMWSHEEMQGMKMKIEEEDEEMMDEEIVEEEEYGENAIEEMIEENPEKNLDYSCDKWKVDEKMFIPPTDVEFVDMAEMMEGFIGEMMGGEGASMELPEDGEMPQM